MNAERATDQREPCAKCPHRKDAPLGLWHPDHFTELLDNDTRDFGPAYGCHNQNGNLCIGWVLDQRKRHLPCLTLRIAMFEEGVAKQVEEAHDGGHAMFESIAAMAVANLTAPPPPRKRSRR